MARGRAPRWSSATRPSPRCTPGASPTPPGLVEVPPGEEHKTLATAERVWHALVAQGATRADHVVALGGGVVGDLAGFCAATYQRGVAVVQVPTTLVAQVDSAYGGKTGVDLPEAKNYVGAYHQPIAVLTDPALLATLPAPELAAGYAEVVKTALIAGGALWDRVAAGAPIDDDVIVGCVRTKLRVVAADERDGGARQALNLGHTVGHAIETATGYARYRHGEAVGLGLLAALRLSGQDALRELVEGLLAQAGLPTRLDGVDAAAVAEATARDKKRTGEAVPYVLVRGAGARHHRPRGRARPRSSPPCESCRTDERSQPRGGHARGQPRPARPPPGGRLRRADLRPPAAAGRGLRARPRAAGALLPDQRRERVRRAPAPPRRPVGRDRHEPRAPGRTTRGPSATRWRSRRCRPSRCTCPTWPAARSGGSCRSCASCAWPR